MKLKEYEREYEYVFSDKDRIDRFCKLDKISFSDEKLDINKYIDLFSSLSSNFENALFDALVKYTWLSRKFCYFDIRRKHMKSNNVSLDKAFGMFLRSYVGMDGKFILGGFNVSGMIIGYFDDFFPCFDDKNPFDEKYEFPYENIKSEYLVVVYQMPERLEILDMAEKKKMSYVDFLDYVINYVSCYNAEHGDTYLFNLTNTFLPYVKYLKK